ncbi:hypothetical protein J6590_033512 [Homalodisca vitripennis]|nr:hypothetical protein J6590_033512 [Homalodisca vitripennis]
MNESGVTSSCDNRAIFVALLKDFSVVLNKSMLPKVASAKEMAWGCLADQFSKNVGKQTSVGQLKKLLNNMKTAVKKKTDVNATGNKPITLLSWEADFLKISESNENPIYCKIPGASCVGLGTSSTSPLPELNEENENREDEDDPVDMLASNQSITPVTCKRNSDATKLKKNKKLKLSAETEETSKLTTGELQRLLLLEQIKLTRLQAEREQMMITELNLRAAQRTESVEKRIVVEEDDVLKEFLLLK